MTTPSAPAEVWFLTGSQGLYGEDVAPPGRRPVAVDRRRRSTRTDAIPATVVVEAGAHRRRRHPPDRPRGQRRRRCVGVDRLDAHVLARRRCGSPGSTRCASRCCTCTPRPTSSCPGPSIDMDFMNLNQAAHGDREFGYIQSRLGLSRKTVAGHVSDPAVVGPRRHVGARRDRRAAPCARCGWPASATTCATSPSPRATRSRPSCSSASRSTPTASTTWSPSSTRSPDSDVDTLVEAVRRRVRRRGRAARRR